MLPLCAILLAASAVYADMNINVPLLETAPDY